MRGGRGLGEPPYEGGKSDDLFFLVQTKMSWRSLLNVWYSRYLSGSSFRAVQFYNGPRNNCGSGYNVTG
jgi:hypothetical protein